jgi:hypothetical protein
MAALTAIPGPCGRGLEAEEIHELAGPDVGLGVEAELLLAMEARDVLVEPRASLRRHVDPELRTDVDVAVQPGTSQAVPLGRLAARRRILG